MKCNPAHSCYLNEVASLVTAARLRYHGLLLLGAQLVRLILLVRVEAEQARRAGKQMRVLLRTATLHIK